MLDAYLAVFYSNTALDKKRGIDKIGYTDQCDGSILVSHMQDCVVRVLSE
jgi:hypothetical protein